jgi:VWFA-related protein
VDAQVIEGYHLVTDLTKDDFVLYDQNQPQKILYFGRESEPLSLLLLLDVSGSMTRYLEQVGDVARRALGFLRRGDRVAVMAFSRKTKVLGEFTDDLDAVTRTIQKSAEPDPSMGAGTAINDALLDAAHYIDQNAGPRGRRSILILTDNLGLNYKSPDPPVVEELYSADAVLNAMVVGRGERPEPARPGHYTNPDFTPPDVFRMSEETGGEAIRANKAGTAFAEMIERIRTRYSLQYNMPPGASGYRKLRVELTPAAKQRYPNAEIRARKGYVAKPS